jgi:hypothetical protein
MFPGQKLHFDHVVALSGYRNVITTNSPPEIFVQDRPADEVVIVSGIKHYLISGPALPSDEVERSREILERLTVLGDWAAGEIVGRQRRDDERHRTGYFDVKPQRKANQEGPCRAEMSQF